MLNRSSFNLGVDHFQFYFGDQDLGGSSDTTHLWDNARDDQRVAIMPGLVAVTTARSNGTARVHVTVEESRPSLLLAGWDRIVEGIIQLPSGEAVLWSPESDFFNAPRVQVSPGKYGLLVTFEGIASVNDEFATEGSDAYHLFLWGPI